jgi:hypothetical protein
VNCERRRVKCKAIPVTGRGGPYGCEKSRLSHFLENRFTDGGEERAWTDVRIFYVEELFSVYFQRIRTITKHVLKIILTWANIHTRELTNYYIATH